MTVKNTEEFSKDSGFNEEKVIIFVASDHIPGVAQFMSFYQAMSGGGFVGAVNPQLINPEKGIPVFRYNAGYRVDLDTYRNIQ